MIDLETLAENGISFDISFGDISDVEQWVLWHPPADGYSWIHHLHLDEDIYQFNVTNSWEFPDHSLQGKIIFAVKKLATEFESTKLSPGTNLLNSIGDFWTTWVSP